MVIRNIVELGPGDKPYPFDHNKFHVTRVDYNPRLEVDVVHDLDSFPYPLADSSADLIYASHVVEHSTQKLRLFWELHRILVPGGIAVVRVPHVTSANAWNFDHYSVWVVGSMNCFQNADFYGNNFPRFEILHEMLRWRITYQTARDVEGWPERTLDIHSPARNSLRGILNRFVSRLANLHHGLAQRIWFLPVGGFDEVEYVIRAVK